MSPWVLILFLSMGYKGGVVVVDVPDAQTCSQMLDEARKMHSYEDGRCFRRNFTPEKEPTK